MTLSIMEDHDTFKTALKDYQNAMGDIPKILERYLGYVARTGKPLFSWDMISSLILKKFENVCESYAADKVIPCVRVSVDSCSTEELKLECLKSLNEFSGVPFTIQRICELLLCPRQNYSKLDKFLRGFIRVIKVVTTVDRVGLRITTESQTLANALSPFQMNESGDNASGYSNHSDESSCNTQNFSPTSDTSCSIEAKCELDYDDPMCILPDPVSPYSGPATTPATINTCINNQQLSPPIVQTLYSNESFFLEQKTIAMPPIGALFKPIDQLETFVQNVSSQVESSNDSVEGSKKRPADDNGMLGTVEGGCEVNEYESPAKKSRLSVCDDGEEEEEEGRQEELSQGDVEEAKEEEETQGEVGSSEVETYQCNEVGESAMPSRSCETSVCAEEASSTIGDEAETEEAAHEVQGPSCEEPLSASSSSEMVVDCCGGGDEEEEEEPADSVRGSGTKTVAAADHEMAGGGVEADQSNCESEEYVDEEKEGSIGE